MGPNKNPQVNAIVVCPIASPTRSGGTLSATMASPTTQTAAAERPCKPRAIMSRGIDRAMTNRRVDAPSAMRPRTKGNRRRREWSANQPKSAAVY